MSTRQTTRLCITAADNASGAQKIGTMHGGKNGDWPKMLNRAVLAINSCYEPCNVISAKRAIHLVLSGKAVVEVPSGQFISTSRMKVQIPSVIRFLQYRRVPRQSRSVSRKGILIRDRHTCQYCRRAFLPKMLTLDHVIPKSRGGSGSWENMVTACVPCNNVKANRTPAEAGMPLPKRPAPVMNYSKHRSMAADPDPAWEPFLFA